MLTVDEQLEIEVGAGSEARLAYQTNPLALFDVLALANRNPAQVAVPALITVIVTDTHVFAVAPFPSREGDRAAGYGPDGGSGGRPVINAVMLTPYMQDGMKTSSEVGGHP